MPLSVNQIWAPGVALVIERVNALEKKPRFGVNFVSATMPITPGAFDAPGVGMGRKRFVLPDRPKLTS